MKEIDNSRNGLPPEVKQAELDSILLEVELLSPKELKLKNKEKEKEKIALSGGGETSIKEHKDIIAFHKQPYKTHFGYEKPFFLNIYKLNGWPEEDHKKYVKRREIPVWIMRLIYARFPGGVIKHVRKQNQFLFDNAYVRRDKYFQYLSDEGQKMLDEFIAEAIQMMAGYDNWEKFESDYCAKFKLAIPGKLF